jgi:Glycosyl transferase family 21
MEDPAFAILRAAQAEPGVPLDVVVAGLAECAGQKVWNLLAALDHLRPEDEIVAFLDADVLLTPLWLPGLVALIVNSGRPVATGYRWMIPSDDRWSSACLAAANASLAALPRGALKLTIVWGGSVAMRRTTFERIRVREFWRGAISDDVQMAKALRRAGMLAYAPRQGLVLTPVSCSWRGFLSFAVRQYRMVYFHRRRSWAIATACLWAPPVCLLLAAPSLADWSAQAWAAFALIVALGEVRTRLRRSLQKALWPEVGGPRDERRWRVERLMRPVWHLAHAVSAAGAPLSRTVNWAGVRYRVNAPQDVIVESRSSVA